MRERAGLIERHAKFFKAYRPRFVDVFLKVCKILNAEVAEAQADYLRQSALDIYDRLVGSDSSNGPLSELERRLHELEEHGVSVSVVLTKTFSVMTHDFVEYAMKTGNAVTPVRALTGILTACLGILDTMEEAAPPAVDKEEGDITGLLQQNGDQILQVETLYKGVPLSHEGIFLSAGDGAVALHLGDSRETIFDFHEEVMISAPFLPKPVLARVGDVDDKRREITVSNLHYASHATWTRDQIRVQPGRPLGIGLKVRNLELEGEVIDLSVSGMAVALDDVAGLQEGDWVHLEMKLPRPGGTIAELSMRGEIQRIAERKNSFRVGLRLNVTPPVEHELSEYITHRQSEVLRQVQATTREPERYTAHPRENLLFKYLPAAAMAVLVVLFGWAVFTLQPPEEERALTWEATHAWLAKQKECQHLATVAADDPSRENATRFERCQRELARMTAPR